MAGERARYVEWLGAAEGGADALGGKGASLDRLARLGFRVPPGFCVTTAAFKAQLAAVRDPEALAAQPLGPAIIDELRVALARLEDVAREPGWAVRLAVRSSAIGEDGSQASFAGLHETELDRTPDDVPDAVRRCWASLWSAPAVAYRAQRRIAPDDAAMAVVVQQLVPADAAAVAFTRHPATGRDDKLVVTAVRGLGDAMVSGTVTPDTFVIDRANPGNVEVTRGDGAEQAIDAAELRDLVETCLAVEGEYGQPVDIEAALAGGRWYLLQARPITSAGPSNRTERRESAQVGDIVGVSAEFPVEFERPGDERLTWEWDDMHMPFATTPLTSSWSRTIAAGFGAWQSHLGVNFRPHTRIAIWNGYTYFGYDAGSEGEELKRIENEMTEVMRAQIPVAEAYWRDEARPELEAIYRQMRDAPIETGTRAEAAAAWQRAWAGADRAWQIHFIAINGPYQVLEDLADLYEKVVEGAGSGASLRLIQGARHELYETELGVEHLAEAAAERPAVAEALRGGTRAPEALAELPGGAEFAAELEGFLHRHGHLGQSVDNLTLASWADEPGLLLAEIAKRLDHVPEGAEARRSRLAAAAEELADGVRARLADGAEERDRFERLLEFARRIGPITEIHNYWIDRMAQAHMHRLALRAGARLARDAVVDRPDDVFYLDRHEVAEVLLDPVDRRAVIAERRDVHERQRRSRPPYVVGKPPDPADGPADRFDGARLESTEANVLLGTGASAGVARGTARVVLTSTEFDRIQPGDVIVCPSSNPSWVPVFTIAGGLVTNTGGVLSHAAVVAREFGLPAVVGAREATMLIRDGQQIEIDGTAGTVRLL